MKDFLMKRVLRIYPGFVVAMVLTVVTIWIVCPEFRIGAEQGIVWLRTLFTDLVSLNNHSLIRNGIFSGNPFPNYGNESLWTIQKEFACYLLVAMLGLFCLFKQRGLILTATLAIYLIYCHKLFAGEATEHSIFRFAIYFLVGMNVWLWQDKIPFTRWFAFSFLVVLLVAIHFKPWFSVIFPYLGAYCTLWFGYGLRLHFLDWTDETDLSYGTYLYAWPIQQIIAMNESLRHHLLNFFISTPIALCLAWLSWNLIEKRFLAIKKSFQVDNIPATTVNVQKSLT
jgi:peptidoglycan/LPS O-acetylase OafA/YrhL